MYQAVDGERDPERYRVRYDGEVRYFDAQFGRLIAWLETNGWYDDALIVFTSDHGESIVRGQAVMGSLQLDFKDRYLIQANMRRDGSSLFGSEQRWANFDVAVVCRVDQAAQVAAQDGLLILGPGQQRWPMMQLFELTECLGQRLKGLTAARI